HIQRSGAGSRTQVVFASSGAQEVWVRGYTTGAWQPWRRILHLGNLVGTVSQSGGVPTGAVIERGSNANGQFVRFADGTMICRHAIALGSRIAFGAGTYADPWRTAGSDWTFPAAFSSAPAVTTISALNSTSGALRNHCIGMRSVSATSAVAIQAVALSSLNTDEPVTAHVTAIGRWFEPA
ncbi:MAG: pyocin knob domain-containing protein, partial [Paracoccaceae bacterium]